MFDFVPTGLAVMATGVLYMTLVGRHLTPERKQAQDLTQQYDLQPYLTEVVVLEGSALDGKSLEAAQLPKKFGLSVLHIRRKNDRESVVSISPATVLHAGDRLVVEGTIDELLMSGAGWRNTWSTGRGATARSWCWPACSSSPR